MKKKVGHLKINTLTENESTSDRNLTNKNSPVMPDINLNMKGGSPKMGNLSSMKNSVIGSVRVGDQRPVSKVKPNSRSVSRNRKLENMSMGIGLGVNSETEGGFQNPSIVNNFLRSSGKKKTDPIRKSEVFNYVNTNNNISNPINNSNLVSPHISNVTSLSNLPSFQSNNSLKITANTPKYSSMNKPSILSPIHSSTNSSTNSNSNSSTSSNNIQSMQSDPNSARNSNPYYNSFNKTNFPQTGKSEQNSNTINVMTLLSSQHIPLSLNTLKLNFNGYESSKYSTKSIGNIRAYAANTHQGTVRNYNEDRVSIILNIVKPLSFTGDYWPKCSIFGVYDGHGGNACADYLRDNLHQFVIKDSNFPQNPYEAIMRGFDSAEKDYLANFATGRAGDVIDRSGSCAIVVFIIDEMCFIANVGDSRAVLSKSNGKNLQVLTNDHKPNDEGEEKRIVESGGRVYQTQTPTRNFNLSAFNGSYNLNLQPNQILVGPYRVFPGRLSVSRTFGDVEAKLSRFGGMQNVVIATPEITSFKITDDMDYIFIGCDGIYDQMSNKDILDSIWMTTKEGYKTKNVHKQCSVAIDMIIKSSLVRKTLDNVTCVIIAFENFERFISPSSILPTPTSVSVSPHLTYKESPTKLLKQNLNDNFEAFDKNSNDVFSLKQCQPLTTKNNRPKNSFALDSTAKEYFLKMDSSNSDNPGNSGNSNFPMNTSPIDNMNKKSPITNFRSTNRKSLNTHIDSSQSNFLTNSNGFIHSPSNYLIGSNTNGSNHSQNTYNKLKNRNSYSNTNLTGNNNHLDYFSKPKSEGKNEILPLVKSESNIQTGFKSKLK